VWIATLRSRLAALRVRPAGKAAERPVRAAASAGQGRWDGVLPDCWLLVEWPADAEAPTDYWLSNLPADTPIADLVRLAKVRWRIEHDYRELKHGLGLDHFEGRSWPETRSRSYVERRIAEGKTRRPSAA
jgi:SRSO17 transposase